MLVLKQSVVVTNQTYPLVILFNSSDIDVIVTKLVIQNKSNN